MKLASPILWRGDKRVRLLTAHSCLIIAKKVLEENFKPGYQTPAGCYCKALIKEIPGFEI